MLTASGDSKSASVTKVISCRLSRLCSFPQKDLSAAARTLPLLCKLVCSLHVHRTGGCQAGKLAWKLTKDCIVWTALHGYFCTRAGTVTRAQAHPCQVLLTTDSCFKPVLSLPTRSS